MLLPLNQDFADGRDSSLQDNHVEDGNEDQEDSLVGSPIMCVCAVSARLARLPEVMAACKTTAVVMSPKGVNITVVILL